MSYCMGFDLVLNEERKKEFTRDLERLINSYSIENCCGMNDFIIADYLVNSLEALSQSVNHRRQMVGE